MAKVDLYPDFKELFASLNSANVKYLLLGGYAVIYYGYYRTTDDLDIWIATDEDNAARVSRVLQEWGGFRAQTVPASMFTQRGKAFIFGREPVRVDILTGPSGVQFIECYERRNVVELDGIRVPIIALDDLKKNKLASGRAKDLADLDNLPPAAPRKPARKQRRRK
jgi:hypothetical protein